MWPVLIAGNNINRQQKFYSLPKRYNEGLCSSHLGIVSRTLAVWQFAACWCEGLAGSCEHESTSWWNLAAKQSWLTLSFLFSNTVIYFVEVKTWSKHSSFSKIAQNVSLASMVVEGGWGAWQIYIVHNELDPVTMFPFGINHQLKPRLKPRHIHTTEKIVLFMLFLWKKSGDTICGQNKLMLFVMSVDYTRHNHHPIILPLQCGIVWTM